MAEQKRGNNQEASSSILGDTVKRALAAGTAAFFLTEEGVRGLLSDLKLPKELVRYTSDQAATGRKEFFKILRSELRQFFKRVDLNKELKNLLDGLDIEIEGKIRIAGATQGKIRHNILVTKVPAKKTQKTTKKKKNGT